MRILPHVTMAMTSPAPVITVVTPAEDTQELRALKDRVQALESQEKLAPRSEAVDPAPLLLQLKAELESQWKSDAAAFRKTLETIEERLHSCEQSPKLLTETVLKEMEDRLRSQLIALDKTVSQRLEKLAVPVVVPAPAPMEKPAAAPEPVAGSIWDARFERHEQALAELMEEITVAAPRPAPVAPTPAPEAAPALVYTPSETSVTAPVEISKPPETDLSYPELDLSPKFELPDDASVTHRPRPRSAVVRFWKYLNAPAFGADRPAD